MKILVFGAGGKSTLAVHSILLNLSKKLASQPGYEITLFGYGDKSETVRVSEKCSVVSIKNPFKKGRFSLQRLERKLCHLLKIDNPLISWKHIFRKAKKFFSHAEFDYVIGVAGQFYYVQAAQEFAKKREMKFCVMYFDSFTFGINAGNSKKRLKREKEWYLNASHIFLDSDDSRLPFEDVDKKTIYFKVPIFEEKSNIPQNGKILYGGTLYSFRGISAIDSLLREEGADKEIFDLYCGKNIGQQNKNVFLHDFIEKDKFNEVMRNCKAVIVIGNGEYKCLPSKLFEALGFKKPIILINFNLNSIEGGSYPLFFKMEDGHVFEKINNFYKNENPPIDIYKFFPERNPDNLVCRIIDALQKGNR